MGRATLALAATSLTLLYAQAAWPCTSCLSGYTCGGNAKYHQVKYVYAGNGSSADQIRHLYYRGGTASGSCDPSNDIYRWRLSAIYIVRASDGKVLWTGSYTPWYYNCNSCSSSAFHYQSPYLYVGQTVYIKYLFQYQRTNGYIWSAWMTLRHSPFCTGFCP